MKGKNNRLGLIHVYTGAGKGKTTTALGISTRALGHGLKVLFVQFMKGGAHIGELALAEKFKNFKIKQFGKICPYSDKMRKGLIDCGNCRDCFMSYDEDIVKAKHALKYSEKAVKSGRYDIVVLDEINVAMSRKIVSMAAVLKMLRAKDKNTEVILTGRNAPKSIIARADVVTEMKEIKHPMKRGLLGRYGIEY